MYFNSFTEFFPQNLYFKLSKNLSKKINALRQAIKRCYHQLLTTKLDPTDRFPILKLQKTDKNQFKTIHKKI